MTGDFPAGECRSVIVATLKGIALIISSRTLQAGQRNLLWRTMSAFPTLIFDSQIGHWAVAISVSSDPTRYSVPCLGFLVDFFCVPFFDFRTITVSTSSLPVLKKRRSIIPSLSRVNRFVGELYPVSIDGIRLLFSPCFFPVFNRVFGVVEKGANAPVEFRRSFPGF